MCRCPATPAPAACPRFNPKLNPCGRYNCSSARSVACARSISSCAASASSFAIRSRCAYGITITCPEVYGYAFRQMKQCLPALHQTASFFCFIHAHPVLDRVIDARNQIAEDAAKIARPRIQSRRHTRPRRPIRRRHIRKSPRTPELIHQSPSAFLTCSVAPSIVARISQPTACLRIAQGNPPINFQQADQFSVKCPTSCIQRHTPSLTSIESPPSCPTSAALCHRMFTTAKVLD